MDNINPIQPDSTHREYRPELIPRRGEAIAWGSALLLAAAWLFLDLEGFQVGVLLPLLVIPLGLAAVSISLGNWMDRHTALLLEGDGISYRNGLRSVTLRWEEILEVRVLPARWGKKVQVFGKGQYFGFHTLGEVSAHGKIMGRTGFTQGEHILKHILEKAQLRLPVGSDGAPSGVYYTRE